MAFKIGLLAQNKADIMVIVRPIRYEWFKVVYFLKWWALVRAN